MDSIYVQLLQDHLNIQRALDNFERLLEEMHCAGRDASTLELIMETLDYIAVYPDQWHHPIEDLIFSHLLGKGDVAAEPVNRALGDHRQLLADTRRITELFYAIANDCAVERDQLYSAAKEYIDAQRQHIERENTEVFPLLEQHLASTDWEQIRTQLLERPAPAIAPELRAHYDALQQRVSLPRSSAIA